MTIDDLKRLRTQLDYALDAYAELRTMTNDEKYRFESTYGNDVALVGDFIIYRAPRPVLSGASTAQPPAP